MVTLDVSFSFYVPSLKYKKQVQIVIVAMKRNSGKLIFLCWKSVQETVLIYLKVLCFLYYHFTTYAIESEESQYPWYTLTVVCT